MKEARLSQPACARCTVLPMLTGTQIINGPNGLTFANLFCSDCGCSIGVVFLGMQQAEQSKIVKPL